MPPDLVLILDAHPRGTLDYRACLAAAFGPEIEIKELEAVGELEELLEQSGERCIACIFFDPALDGLDLEEIQRVGGPGNPAPPIVLVVEDDADISGVEKDAFDIVFRGRRQDFEARRALRHALERSSLKHEVQNTSQNSKATQTSDSGGPALRAHFRDIVAKATQRNGEDRFAAVMLIGLDDFKAINTALGHAAGDALLEDLTQRLRHCFRNADVFSKWGTDEFAVLLEDMARPSDAEFVVQRIRYALSRPFSHQGQEIIVTASIGISVFPSVSSDANELLKQADAAMYRVRKAGGNDHAIYSDEESTAQTKSRLRLVSRLRGALSRDEFSLHYQPILDVAESRVVAVEALLRWNDGDTGFHSPAEFVPLLEQTGLIAPVGEWVIRKACTQARAWQYAGLSNLKVSVNVSAKQFGSANLTNAVAGILKETGLAPESLQLELTESALMDDRLDTGRILEELKSLGLGLALDDFGTGYSSLALLKTFPVDTLKVDRAFVRDICKQREDQAILQAIVQLAGALDLSIVAEGVEDEEQLSFLKERGLRLIQGYLFARPMSAEDTWTWLTRERRAEVTSA